MSARGKGKVTRLRRPTAAPARWTDAEVRRVLYVASYLPPADRQAADFWQAAALFSLTARATERKRLLHLVAEIHPRVAPDDAGAFRPQLAEAARVVV